MSETRASRTLLVVGIGLTACVAILAFGLAGIERPEHESRSRRTPGASTPDPRGEVAPVSGAATREADESRETPAADGEPRKTLRLTVLGPGDRPLPGVRLTVRRPDAPRGPVTDAAGRVEIEVPPGETALDVRLGDAVPPRDARLSGPETVLRFPDLLPLEVAVVDGDTGRSLPGAEVRLWSRWVRPEGDEYVLDPAPIEAGTTRTLSLEVEAPPGYVPEEPRSTIRTPISRLAERVRTTVVLRPELDARLRVLTTTGRPVAGVAVEWVSIAGRVYRPEGAVTSTSGETRLRGLPRFRGHSVTVIADRGGHSVLGTGTVPADGPVVVVIRVSDAPPPPVQEVAGASIGIGGGAGGSMGGRGGHRTTLDSRPKARLEVEVLRRTGAPARGATVRVEGDERRSRGGVTDGEGRCVLDGLDPGPVRVTATEPGLIACSAEVTLVRDRTTVVRLVEPDGLPLVIEVRDAHGPVPFAAITVRPGGREDFAILDGTTQIVGLRTDVLGRLRIPALPAGRVLVTATYGGLATKATADAGGTLVLRIGR